MLRVKWFGSCSLIQRGLGPTGLSGLRDSVAGISQVTLRQVPSPALCGSITDVVGPLFIAL